MEQRNVLKSDLNVIKHKLKVTQRLIQTLNAINFNGTMDNADVNVHVVRSTEQGQQRRRRQHDLNFCGHTHNDSSTNIDTDTNTNTSFMLTTNSKGHAKASK